MKADTSMKVPAEVRDRIHDRTEKGQAYWETVCELAGWTDLLEDE